jgi:hypothetical protein
MAPCQSGLETKWGRSDLGESLAPVPNRFARRVICSDLCQKAVGSRFGSYWFPVGWRLSGTLVILDAALRP